MIRNLIKPMIALRMGPMTAAFYDARARARETNRQGILDSSAKRKP